jgi:hypothetical protein
MDGILILYRHRGHRAGVIPRTAAIANRAVNVDVHMEEALTKPLLWGLSRPGLVAPPALARSVRNVVTLYPRYTSLKMTAVRRAALQASPGTNERMVLVLPFSSHDGRHEGALHALNAQAHDAQSSGAMPYQMKELLSAALANSHACQNWLNFDSPNLERARLSIANVTRDLKLAAHLL